MTTLALKLTLAPILIAVASLAGRRWGPAVSGWLIGLPFTSGPVIFLLAIARGSSFAAAAAEGTLAGTMSGCAFCLAYGWLATRGWLIAIVGGCLAFFAGALTLEGLTLPLISLSLVVLVVLIASLWLMRSHRALEHASSSARPAGATPPWWDLPLRMALAACFVVLLTSVAPALGPRLTGLLAPFPIYATILAVFAHRQDGPVAAARVLRGLLLGLFSFAAFFVVLAALLVRLGVAPAFLCATLAALIAQGCSLWLMRRPSAQAVALR